MFENAKHYNEIGSQVHQVGSTEGNYFYFIHTELYLYNICVL
jgi:hypothetical protein